MNKLRGKAQRAVGILLAAAMLASAAPAQVFADETSSATGESASSAAETPDTLSTRMWVGPNIFFNNTTDEHVHIYYSKDGSEVKELPPYQSAVTERVTGQSAFVGIEFYIAVDEGYSYGGITFTGRSGDNVYSIDAPELQTLDNGLWPGREVDFSKAVETAKNTYHATHAFFYSGVGGLGFGHTGRRSFLVTTVPNPAYTKIYYTNTQTDTTQEMFAVIGQPTNVWDGVDDAAGVDWTSGTNHTRLAGWSETEDAEQVQYALNEEITPAAGMTLYTVWEPVSYGYTVEYYYDGVQGDAPDNTASEAISGTAGYDTKVVIRPQPSVSAGGKTYLLDPENPGTTEINISDDEGENRLFVYYVSDKNGDQIPDKDQTVTLTFQGGEHGSIVVGDESTASKTYTLLPEEEYPVEGQDFTVEAEDDWCFIGWDTAYEFTGRVPANQTSVEKTYTAQYAPDLNHDGEPDEGQTVILTFQAGEHGSFAAEDGETASKTYTLLPDQSYPAAPDVEVESGWLLAGWYDAEGNEYKATGTVGEEDASATYTASYEEDRNGDEIPDKEQQYTVTYTAEKNGTVKVDKETACIQGVAGIQGSQAVADTGYTVDGWYKENVKIADGSTLTPDVIKEYLNTDSKGLYEDTTFTARFVKQETPVAVLTGYTVRYLEDGTGYEVASPKTVSGVAVGTTVTETAPDIAGYTVTSDKNPQSITLVNGDNSMIFYYKAVGEETEPAPVAVTPAPAAVPVIPTTPTAPAATRAPAAGPSVTAAPTTAPTEEPAAEEVVPEEETPQAQEPADESIADEETPLAGSTASGWAVLNLILALVAAIGAVVLVVGYFMGHTSVWRLLSLIPGIGGVAAFLLTEDMSQSMTFVDGWTVLMGVIVVVQIAVAVMSLRSKGPYQEPYEEEEDEDEA